MRAPRLRERDHRITSFLIRVFGNPWSLLVLSVLYVALWNYPATDRFVGLGGLLIGMLDILSNSYQEVSADQRQLELQTNLNLINDCTKDNLEKVLAGIERIEKKANNPYITIL